MFDLCKVSCILSSSNNRQLKIVEIGKDIPECLDGRLPLNFRCENCEKCEKEPIWGLLLLIFPVVNFVIFLNPSLFEGTQASAWSLQSLGGICKGKKTWFLSAGSFCCKFVKAFIATEEKTIRVSRHTNNYLPHPQIHFPRLLNWAV